LGEVGEKDVDCPIYELSIYKIKKKKKKKLFNIPSFSNSPKHKLEKKLN